MRNRHLAFIGALLAGVSVGIETGSIALGGTCVMLVTIVMMALINIDETLTKIFEKLKD